MRNHGSGRRHNATAPAGATAPVRAYTAVAQVLTEGIRIRIRIRKRAMSLMTHPVVRWLFARVGKFLPVMQQRERPIA